VPNNTKPVFTEQSPGALELFHPAVRDWFESVFTAPTRPQSTGWPPIARNESTLILAPTGTGKTLAALLWCINRIMFSAVPAKSVRNVSRRSWRRHSGTLPLAKDPRRRFCRRRRTSDA
jgi:superfamily II DNA/RNA helicase